VRPVSGNWGIGAEIAGSATPRFATPFSGVAGRLVDAAGGALTAKPSLDLPLELPPEFVAPEFFAPAFVAPEFVAPALVASRSDSWSRRSDSIRPFEVSSWYPERDGVESAYHAVTFVLTRTTDPPDAIELTCTADW
jgi:hypothetical protein